MKDFKKVVNPVDRTFCKIQFKDGNLSISGVEGPIRNGGCKGGCGQINPVSGNLNNDWSKELLDLFNSIWDEWHLNDMNAGTKEQQEFLRELKESGWKYDYNEACDKLKAVGLYEVEYNGEPYCYGHAWIREDIPADIISFLESLPDTKVQPAWV